jgi:16S rRNA (guanine966-N2)-methyltransferase
MIDAVKNAKPPARTGVRAARTAPLEPAPARPGRAAKRLAAVRLAQRQRPAKPPGERARRNSVRVIGGTWRGRRIEFPDVPGLRPTADRIRETLFNWLQDSLAGARCLDLFAGSGALGLEALSRGAREAVFVEQAVPAARALQQQLLRFGAVSRGRVAEMGARRYLGDRASSGGTEFDLVFLDPPFGLNALPEYVALLAAGDWVKPGGLIYLECEKSAGRPALPETWEFLKSKSAGEVGYHLARANAATHGQ